MRNELRVRDENGPARIYVVSSLSFSFNTRFARSETLSRLQRSRQPPGGGTPVSYLHGLTGCRNCTAGRFINTPYADECSWCHQARSRTTGQ